MSILSSRMFRCFDRTRCRKGAARRQGALSQACQSEVLESRQLLTQIITATANNATPAVGGQVEIAVNYSTTNLAAAQSQSLSVQMHFNSQELEFVGFKSGTYEIDGKVEPADITAPVLGTSTATGADSDGDANTDKFIKSVWNVALGNWPGTVDGNGNRVPNTLPSELYVAVFNVKTGFNGEAINFTGIPQGGEAFQGTSVQLAAAGPKQIVTPSVNVTEIGIGGTFEVTVPYSTSGLLPANSQSLGMQMHFNSQELEFVGFKTGFYQLDGKVEPADITAPVLGVSTATGPDSDGDANTDKFVKSVWNVALGNWPGTVDGNGNRVPNTQPTTLYVAVFKALAGFNGETINFTGVPQGGATFESTSATVSLAATPAFNFDIDGNGVRNAFQDAVIAFAWMLGPDISDADFQKLIPANANAAFNTPAEIRAHLDASQALFDIDGNGTRNAFQDAVLLYAWMLGPDISDADFQKLIPANAAQDRNSPAEIKAYLNNLQGIAAPAATQQTANNIVLTPQPVVDTTTPQPADSGTTGVTPIGDQTPLTNDETAFLEPGEEDEPDLFNFDSEPSVTSKAAVRGLDLLFAAMDGGASIPDDLLDRGL